MILLSISQMLQFTYCPRGRKNWHATPPPFPAKPSHSEGSYCVLVLPLRSASPLALTLRYQRLKSGRTTCSHPGSSGFSFLLHPTGLWTTRRRAASTREERFLVSSIKKVRLSPLLVLDATDCRSHTIEGNGRGKFNPA